MAVLADQRLAAMQLTSLISHRAPVATGGSAGVFVLPPLRSAFLCPLHSNSPLVDKFVLQRNITDRRKNSRDCAITTIVNSVRKFESNDFEVKRLLSTYGYINITSVTPRPGGVLGEEGGGGGETAAAGFNRRDVLQMSGQEVGEGGVQTRLYTGRMSRGQEMGTRVLLKAYPGITARGTAGMTARGTEVDLMAANELLSHASLQEAPPSEGPTYVASCYGGFQTRTGEQWLVFQDWGRYTATDYALMAGKATSEQTAVGQWDFWDRFDKERPIQRRRIFVTKLLRGAFTGLAFMHANDRLHQSLGPSSVLLNTIEERDALDLVPQLRDLAFAVDVSDRAMGGGPTVGESFEKVNTISDLRDMQTESPMAPLSESLWKRAELAGARTSREKKIFGIADDIYAAGLLLAYVIFVSFSEPGSVDGPSLQRLLESTFRLDIDTAREYFKADDRCAEAAQFLDLDDGAGWQLLQALLNPNFRMRPTAEAVLSHRFMTGAVL